MKMFIEGRVVKSIVGSMVIKARFNGTNSMAVDAVPLLAGLNKLLKQKLKNKKNSTGQQYLDSCLKCRRLGHFSLS